MKKIAIRVLTLTLFVFFVYSCNEEITIDEPIDDLELKSGNIEKISYIVLVNDAELNTELSNLKGYEKKQQAVKLASAKILKRAGVIGGEVEHVYGTAVKGFSIKIPPGQLNKLVNDPAVLSVEEDQIITLIEPKAKPGDGDVEASAAQVTPWGITRVYGGATYTGSKVAWIIDTGIDLDHPDLNVNEEKSATFVDRTTTANDDNGHGSHVAGTVAAKNNDIGVIGVAAGATVVPIKVLDRRGSGYYSWIIAGIDYVAGNAATGDVANMSLGGGVSETLDNAVVNASSNGIYFSLAAGNESDDANNHSPARADGDYIYTISAMDINDNWASFSNYGNPPIDYCEPGVSIYSTYKDGGYTTYSGTSMAAPHMAGLLLLGNLTNDGTVNGDPDGNPDPIRVYDGTVTPPDNYPPTAAFNFSVNDLTVTFTDESGDSDGNVVGWSWNFGDETTSISQNPEHIYDVAGTYSVTLTVTDNDGANDFVSKDVTVSESTGDEAPTIGDVVVTNTSNPAWKRVSVNWTVNDNNGDLQTMKSEFFDPSGKMVDSATTVISGSSASGIHELANKRGPSGTYTVVITVTDNADNSDSDSYTKEL